MLLTQEQREVYERAKLLGLELSSPSFIPLYTFSDDNKKYRVQTEDGPLFLKWGASDRGKASLLKEIGHVRLLDELNLSPKLVAASETLASYATVWTGGTDGAELPDEKRLELVWSTLSKIHSIDPVRMEEQAWDKLFLFTSDPDQPHFPEELPANFTKKLGKAYFEIRELEGKTTIHGDFHTGNVVFRNNRLFVMDPEHMQAGVAGWDFVYYLAYDDAGMSTEKRAAWLKAHLGEKELKLFLEYLLARAYTWATLAPKDDPRGDRRQRGQKNILLALPLYEELFK